MKNLFIRFFSALAVCGFVNTAAAFELLTLSTTQAGMHRITYEQLVDAGADLAGLRHDRFGLSLNGEWVQLATAGKGGGRNRQFGGGGYIEFYAEPADSLYRDEQVYVLHMLANRSLANRKSIQTFHTRVNRRLESASSYLHTAVIERNVTYDFSSPSSTDPYHFGQTFSFFATPSYQFEVDNLAATVGDITVDMYGLLDFAIEGNDHHFEIEVNGIVVGDQQFDGNSATQLAIDNAPLQAGTNTLKYNYRAIAGVPFDRIALNQFSVSYRRSADAEGQRYLAGFVDAEQLEVSNFGEASANVYRRLDDGHIEKLNKRGIRYQDDSVVFNTGGVAAEYLVIGESAYPQPTVQEVLEPTDITSGTAEYLIITHASLQGAALDELVALRAQDYLVKVVDVADIYAQFGHHMFGAEGIQSYIKHAATHMGTTMVVLLGSDTLDYKNITSSSVSLVPTRYVTTPGGALTITQTPSDVAYGDLNEDGIPELVVARISARTPSELANVVSKIKAYENRSGYLGRTVVVTDKNDLGNGVSFSKDADDMIAAIPSEWSDGVREDFRVYPDIDGHQQAHDKLLSLINQGVSVVSYIGHSSQQSWAYTTPPMLRASQVADLTNLNKPTVVTQWGCWNTYFVDPRGNTISDMLLLSGENGAASVMGASTLTSSVGERALGIELNKRMYLKGMTIGEAMIQAKQALAQYSDFPAVQLGWHLLGDPALKINP
ncbi:C25 family cysteine peptidase [Arenicella xantha]|uniref:Peptidase C25-like protein n=1 Tax=Arenicella xantha TaxID=644221 RepID=A0A395JQM2_9GAMM|nr:C25 family cysteine peptidase [Arenicella xantha]RBP51020.1 peptidase C25-like protein [Arenicella xantha]